MGNYLYAYRNYVGTFSSGNERGTELSGICRNFHSDGSSYMDHPEWNYGFLISNFAEATVLTAQKAGWTLGFKPKNTVYDGKYGLWFAGECKDLRKACQVYGNQGLELDCPIIMWGGDYIRQDGQWVSRGWTYDNQSLKYKDPNSIVENNHRVLLTRDRKEMMLFIPNDSILDETYQYFIDMGMDII